LVKELDIDNSLGNPTFIPTTLTKEEILDNHRSVLCSFGISTKDEELDLPLLYWIPKLRDRCLATFGSLKIDVERVLIDPLSF
jgi:hypothetical protein